MAIGWKFPPNSHGSEHGLNDPGIETFLSRPLESLAREVIQNSRDAAIDPAKPVLVEFTLYDVPREIFPGADELQAVLAACGEYWRENVKSAKFFATAQQLLLQDNITFLKISDYNTNGLAGAQESRGRDWHKLTKSVGASDKREGMDGSFGIGKHAPFACSAFRTVFYGTKVAEDKTTAFQGVAKLVTHVDSSGATTQGTGYYGEKQFLEPLLTLDRLNEFYRRRRYGTDIFIPGFVYNEQWEDRIVKSVLNNFLVSIYDGKLSVTVGETRIDQTSLPELMAPLEPTDGNATRGFYDALVDANSHVFFEEDFMGMGRIELNIVVGEHLPKQVAMVRQSGMLVYVKKRFRTPLRFAGVFIARGEKLNTFLTSLEPPAHDNWEPERHVEDVAFARKVLHEMHSWIVDRIKELTSTTLADEIDPEGLGQYLPDELDEDDRVRGGGEDEMTARPRPIELQSRIVVPSSHEHADGAHGSDGADATPAPDPFNNQGGGGSGGESTDEIEGSGDAEDGTGTDPSSEGSSPVTKLRKVELQKFRFFCSDAAAGEYIVSFVPKLVGEGYIELNVVGEVGNELAPIRTAKNLRTGEAYAVPRAGVVGPVEFSDDQRIELSITLKEQLRCAMEITAYAS